LQQEIVLTLTLLLSCAITSNNTSFFLIVPTPPALNFFLFLPDLRKSRDLEKEHRT
jgi:hypothetical protein